MDYKEIDKRYSDLAQSNCCLSCGGALNYADVKPGETCVDLGSGRGTDVIRMAEKAGSTGFGYGIDISEGMIKKSLETSGKLGITNVSFISCPLETLKLNDGIADVVISNCTINHASDKQKVWTEIFRVLKPGGRFVISDIYSLNAIPGEYRNDPVAVAECWAGAVTRDEYVNQVKYAGFKDIKILEESTPYEKGMALVCSWTISGVKQN